MPIEEKIRIENSPFRDPWNKASELNRVGTASCIGAGLCALLVLAGWIFDIPALKRVFSHLITMKANTAVCLLALSIASYLGYFRRYDRARLYLTRGLALFVFTIAVGTMGEYALNKNIGIDEILVSDPETYGRQLPAGRLAPVTAIDLALLSVTLLLTSGRKFRWYRSAQFFIFAAFLLSFQALVAYCFGINYQFGLAYYTQMAVPTALAMVLVCVGQLCLHQNQGLMRVLTSRTPGGHMARSLFFWAILVPPAVNWLQIAGQRAGLYDNDFGVLLRVIGNVLLLVVIVWRNALALQLSDQKQDDYATELEIKNSELRQFAWIVSHDLREPVRMVNLFGERLVKLQGDDCDSETQRCVQFVREGATRINSLITDMAAYTQLTERQCRFETVDSAEVCSQALSQLREKIERAGASVEIGFLPKVNGNEIELVHLFKCLIDNSVKFRKNVALQISIAARAWDEDTWLFSVRDNGIGIEPSYRRQIFEIFKRLNRRVADSGTGMGLSICAKIIERHRGAIWVDSEGDGSIFYFKIPAARTSAG